MPIHGRRVDFSKTPSQHWAGARQLPNYWSNVTVLTRYAYNYDPAGNGISEQIDDTVFQSGYDANNRVTSHTADFIMARGLPHPEGEDTSAV